MKIIFFWVKDFLNIKNQSMNFGSKYFYSLESKGTNLVVDRAENKDFIEGFYNQIESGVVNISALVGDNGSGKSNFLDALKKALSSDRDWFEYLILFENEEGKVFFKKKENQIDILERIKTKEVKEKYIKVISNNFSISNVVESNSDSESVFYSPILDYRIYPITHDNNQWIDVSIDFLMHKVFQDEKNSKNEISQIDLFRFFEIKTQLNVLRNKKVKEELEKHISIPDKLTVFSTGFNVNKDLGSYDFKYIPYELKGVYLHIMKLSDDKLQNIEIERENRSLEEVEAEKVYGFFLEHIFNSFYWHLNRSRNYHKKFKFVLKEADFSDSSMKNNLKLFFKELNASGFQNDVDSFLDLVENLVYKNYCEFFNADSVSFDCSVDDFEKLYESNQKFLIFLRRFTRNSIPVSFLDFSWRNLSSGEKAFFNIFSRFFYARDLIIEKWKEDKTPDFFYILIDEGELGFHLSWQKNYISTLIEFVPLAFAINGKKPKVHVIFTSHSPMSLSDIPRYNVSYIRKDHDKKAEVLENDEKPDKTFGANVHSLLIHSFFLDDGLIGDFSRNRINEIIDLINSDQLSAEKRMWIIKHIEIIDEPILKAKLMEMFFEKFEKESELRRLEALKEEIESKIQKLK